MRHVFDDESARIEAFGEALDALRKEVETSLGEEDVAHIERIGRLSWVLEVVGRGLIHISFDPITFRLGVAPLWGHKSLELMEIGHMVPHRCYDKLEVQYLEKSWPATLREALVELTKLRSPQDTAAAA